MGGALACAKWGQSSQVLRSPPDSQPALFDLARVQEGIGSRLGDLRDPQAVLQAVDAGRA